VNAFKLDENLPLDARDLLRAAGFDVLTVHDQALQGSSDDRVAQVCREEGRALVTLGLDFADVRTFLPAAHPGLIVLRPGRLDRHAVVRLLERGMDVLKREPLAGHLWIVGDDRVRIWPSH
jgi:predicted nuclease of predicted toxin-antitoxin system